MIEPSPQAQEAAQLARAKALFLDAIEMGIIEREAFVDSQCNGDAALRKLVLELLEGESLPLPVESLADDIRAAATSQMGIASGVPGGSMIGRYRLIERLGEGGFGVVFAAEQTEPVKRRVAVKLIKLGMDTRQVIARFEAERQALAMMEHPGIAKVFDAGATETGRPYFVMELVKGLPITEYCDLHRLDIRARLTLLVQVCEAVQHAHGKGIIHRDLKPSNVLITEAGTAASPKIIDFGIAKATGGGLTDKTIYTQARQMIGTPEYMSPEQASGSSLDIDTRSDVYSLGVILYELLSGVTPIDSARLASVSYGEAQRIISEEDPPRPSAKLTRQTQSITHIATSRRSDPHKLATSLRGELDWIAMKAMEKDRNRRYDSASALATDIARYLAGETVLAVPPSRIYQLRKFVRRNLILVTAGSMVAAALLIGAAGFAWQARVAGMQRDEAIKARSRTESTNQFVIKLLQSGDPNAPGGGENTTILRAMQSAIEDLNSGKFSDDPETDASLRLTIAGVLQHYTRAEDAAPLYEQALSSLRRHHQSDHPEIAKVLSQLAYMRYGQYRGEEASKLAIEAVEMLQRLYRGGSDETVHALGTLALLQPPDQPQKALAMFRQALEMNQSLHPGDHEQSVTLMWNVGTAEVELGQAASGEAILQVALDMSRRLRPEQPMLISHSWGFLAYAKRDLGKFAEAERCCTESYETYKNLIGQPTWERAGKQRNLGLAKLEAGKPAEGEVLCTSALLYLTSREQPLTALTQSDRARCRWLLGRRDEARSDFDEAVAIMRRLAGPNGGGPGLAEVLFYSATARLEDGDLTAALTELQEADTIAQRTMAPERRLRRDIREALLKCKPSADEPKK